MRAARAPSRSALAVVLALALLAPAGCRRQPPEAQGDRGDAGDAAAGAVEHRPLELAAGTFLHLRIEQEGADVVVRLRDPQGETVVEVDSPTGGYGPEELLAIAPASGRYRLEIEILKRDPRGPGTYVLQPVARRPATAADRELLAADRAYLEGRRRFKEAQRGGGEAAGAALAAYDRALATWQARGLPSRAAEALHAICRVHELRGEHGRAVLFCDRAAALLAASPEGDAERRRAVFLDRAGYLRLKLGEPQRAIASCRRAVALFERHRNHRAAALALSHLASAELARGDLQRAASLFERALQANARAGHERDRAAILLDQGRVFLALARPHEALANFRQARRLRPPQRASEIAGLFDGIAHAALQLGDVAAAEAAIGEGMELLRRQGASPRAQALVLGTLGIVHRREGDLDAARAVLDEALRLARRAQDGRTEGIVLLTLAHLHVLRGEPARGLELAQRAETLFTAAADDKWRASCRARAAQALRDLGRLEEAWQQLEPALEVVEDLRRETVRRDFRSAYFASRQDYFEIAIDVLVQRHRREPSAGFAARALALDQRRRALELRDALALHRTGEADEALRRREEAIGRRLSALRRDVGVDPAARRQRVAELLGELDRARGEARRARLDGLPQPPATDVDPALWRQRLLGDDDLLLVYALGEERSYLWSASRRRPLAVAELPGRRALIEPARRFAARCREIRRRSAGPRRQLGAELGRLLLAPVAGELDHRRLLLVLDGPLQMIPFAALRDPRPPAEGGGGYLIAGHEVVALPSVPSLLALRRRLAERRPPRRAVAVFGDPVFSAGDPRVGGGKPIAGGDPALLGDPARDVARSAEALGVDALARLPGSRREVEAIRALVPPGEALVALDFEASRETLEAAALADYRVLHFATHALLDREHPELSGLVLSLVDPAGRPRDGFLRAFELAGLELPVELVVLSACETGAGKVVPGEGVLGLGRGFFEA
ncbi:MAG: CHAT domain-containing protein, partial [Acidobacteria bacterium]